MKIYEIDTGCLEANKGATIIKMVSVESIIEFLEKRCFNSGLIDVGYVIEEIKKANTEGDKR